MKKIIVTIFLFGIIAIAFTRPRFINLNKEIKSSNFVGLVEIMEYLVYKDNTGESDNYKNIKSVKMRIISNDSLILANTKKSEYILSLLLFVDYSQKYSYTGFWPNTGDTVLVVIDSLDIVSTFGVNEGEYYRIWSPYETGSSAIFDLSSDIHTLPGEGMCSLSASGTMRCWDGCLVRKKYLNL